MQKLVWQNADGVELDLTSGNYGITEWEGFSNTGLNIQSQQVPFQDGGVFLDALIEQRELSVTLAIQDRNNLELRYQQRRELISALNPKLGEGYLIYTNDFISKRIKCIPQIPIFETHNSDMSGTPKASLSWVACEPYWEDLEETSVTFKGVQTVENEGDIPAQIKAVIPYVSNNPVLMNSRNNKTVGLEGSIKNTVTINTNVGEKSVLGQKMGFQWVRGGAFNNTISKNGKTYYFSDSVTLEENDMTGEISTSDYSIVDIPIGSIAYGNGVFVGVGDNKAYTSYDGVNWTLRETFTSYISSVYFVNGRFIAIEGYIYSSYDGITWTPATRVGGNGGLRGVAYGNGIYLAVGCVYNQQTHRWEPNVQKSIDCDNWDTWSAPIHDQAQLYKIAFGNGIFVAITQSHSWNIRTTTDGDDWTETSFEETFFDIIFVNGLFVIVGDKGIIRTSTDGVTWTLRTSGTDGRLSSVFYQNGKYIICGNECILESEDGIDWDIKYGGDNFQGLLSLAYNDDVIVAVGWYSIISSTDGENWTLRKSFTLSEGEYTKVIWANNMFVAVGGYTSPLICTSPDGIEWTSREVTGSGQLKGVAYGNGVFVAVGLSIIFTSTDGITWTSVSMSEVYNFYAITFANGRFVAVGSGVCAVSQDGENWTSASVLGEFRDVTFGNNRFVTANAGISSTTFYISTDGINWSIGAVVNARASYVYYANNVFLATEGWSKMFISSDAVEWQPIEIKIFSQLYAITFFRETWYIAGDAGVICKSIILKDMENLISNLTPNSDMTFNLEIGENNLFFADDNGKEVTITFRQKYIGV